MTLPEIVSAIQDGKKVYYDTLSYEVVYNFQTGYFIQCTITNHRIGLTWEDGRTLNGDKDKFFTISN